MPRLLPGSLRAAFYLGVVAAVLIAQHANARRSPAPMATAACNILTPQLAALAGAPGTVSPTEAMKDAPRLVPHCAYRWVPSDLESQHTAYHADKARYDDAQAKKRRILLRKPVLPVGEHYVELDWYDVDKSAKAARATLQISLDTTARARARFELGGRKDAQGPSERERAMAMPKGGLRSSKDATVRSPGETAGSQEATASYFSIPDVGDEAYWWPGSGTLMVRDGRRRFTLDVRVAHFAPPSDPAYRIENDDNLTVAATLAKKLAARVR